MVILLSSFLSDQTSNIPATNPPTERNIDILGTKILSIKFTLADDTTPAIFALNCVTLIFAAHPFPHIGIFLTIFFTLIKIFVDILITFLKSAISGVFNFAFNFCPDH